MEILALLKVIFLFIIIAILIAVVIDSFNKVDKVLYSGPNDHIHAELEDSVEETMIFDRKWKSNKIKKAFELCKEIDQYKTKLEIISNSPETRISLSYRPLVSKDIYGATLVELDSDEVREAVKLYYSNKIKDLEKELNKL